MIGGIMALELTIPSADEELKIAIDDGEVLFALGANGVGKSGLMQHISQQHRDRIVWISAHRQNWFQEFNNMSAQQRESIKANIRSYNQSADARFIEHQAEVRVNATIYDLVGTENKFARQIAEVAREADLGRLEEVLRIDPPLRLINGLLRHSNIAVELSIDDKENVVASKNGSDPYSVARLSDGERNALLIGVTVLTAEPGALLLIDEPERHLHRSIISPLLSQLFAIRSDCMFLVSTHDILLSTDVSDAKVLLIRECLFNGDKPTAWVTDLVQNSSSIDDQIKRDILGSRRKIIFVEGTENSLDKPLYSIVFGDTSVVAKSNCRDVDLAVSGIRQSADLHWVQVWGVIDNDQRPAAEIETLREKGVHALPLFSVESIYYHPEVQRRVAIRLAAVSGDDVEALLTDANQRIVAAVTAHRERLPIRAAEKEVRRQFFNNLPTARDISTDAPDISINIDVAAIVTEQQERLEGYIAANDIEAIVSHYPIRHTPALNNIVDALGFRDRKKYESAVLKLLEEDADALEFVKSLFGDLVDEVTAA